MTDDDDAKIKSVAGITILYVMATQAEYLEALQSRIQPLICQVGPVEAAMNVAGFLSTRHDIDLVVSLGSAGSARLEQAEVYQVTCASYRDMDASAFGFTKGETPFLDLPASIDLGLEVPGIKRASISTGANIVSGSDYHGIDADMVDMETWAVMRACHSAQVPLIGLRGISDGAAPVAEYSDWSRYLHVVDSRLGEAVDQLEAALSNGTVKLENWRPPQPRHASKTP